MLTFLFLFSLIIFPAFMIYVVLSISTIKYRQDLIMKHFNIREEQHEKLSDEVIENELERGDV